jgi:3'-5' exoribonuclease
MKQVIKLSDIDFDTQEAIEFEATISEIINEGLEESKRPIRVSVKLEESGEIIQAVSWNYKLLDLFRQGLRSIDVMRIEALSGRFNNQDQIRIGNAEFNGSQSTKKVIKTIDVMSLKREYEMLVRQYIQTQSLLDVIDELLLNNPKFFLWPAATKMHHAYEGGLAIHTLQVTKHAINIWKEYEGHNMDIEVIVASALLHDVAKLDEYEQDGTRNVYGSLIGHIVGVFEKIGAFFYRKGLDPYKDQKVMMVRHCVLAHHGQLDFGSPVIPATLEAFVVSKADTFDAIYDGIQKQVDEIPVGDMTIPVAAAERAKFLRWK